MLISINIKKIFEILFILICIVSIIHSFRNKISDTEFLDTVILDLVGYYIVYKFAQKDIIAELVAVVVPADILIAFFFRKLNTKVQCVLFSVLLIAICTLSRLIIIGFITFKFV